MAKQTLSGGDAREALQRGIDSVANPVKVTLGPRGRFVLMDRPGQPVSTRDGVSVAKEVSNLPNPFENMGAAYAREVADHTVVEAGDGTTTATVILQAIVRDGLKAVSAGAEPLLLADGIAMATEACVESIKRLKIDATPELVKQAAIISTHGDVQLGTLIAEATCKVGTTGVLELQESRDEHTTIEHVEGFYFERGWRPYQIFARDGNGQKCVLRNPLILISERAIVGAGVTQNGNNLQILQGDGLGGILQAVVKTRRAFLIIGEELAGDALNMFVANVHAGQLPGGCYVKLPGFGESRDAAVEDLRIAVGAKRVHSKTSTRLDDQLSSFTADDLGFCGQAVISPTRTVLLNGGANSLVLQKRIKQLIDQSQESTNPLEKEQLDHRIARLTGGVAVLRVGGKTEPEMLEKKQRAEDAILACRCAIEQGLVPGGGMALAVAAKYGMGTALMETKDDVAKGARILLSAIQEPAKQIMRNAAFDPEAPLKGMNIKKAEWGFNAATGESGDLIMMGIVDPMKVVITALTKAASIARLLLTTEVLCTDIPEVKPQPQPQMPAAVRM